MLNELRAQRHKTQASLAAHVDEVRALQHEAAKAEVASRELTCEHQHELRTCRHAASSPSGHHDPQRHSDMNANYQADNDNTLDTQASGLGHAPMLITELISFTFPALVNPLPTILIQLPSIDGSPLLHTLV
ncbi:hypothetical protein OG21DRAFT_916613 [Imleria badia]|nr:hypothetical protein OG21DRAFT_916613 [Imleria badia]